MGPLWEYEPKTDGFRLVIPDPIDIFNWIKESAAKFGDSRELEIEEDLNEALLRLLSGESEGFLPLGTRIWKVEVEDDLISNTQININARYSPESGDWGNVACVIELTEQAIQEEKGWLIPSLDTEIANNLRKRGLTCSLRKNRGFNSITIPNKDNSSVVDIYLGFSNLEAALQDDPGDLDYTPSTVTICINKPSLSLPEMLKELQHFQYAVSHSIDTIYETCGLDIPNVELQLSKDYEIK